MYGSIPAVELAIAATADPTNPVMKDRQRFTPFFEVAEAFAHKRGMVIGGAAATRLLLGKPLGPQDYHYELYSASVWGDAQDLTRLFYEVAPDGLGHYASATMKVAHEDYEISVDERPLIRVKLLPFTRRGGRAADAIVPTERPADFARGAAGEALPLACMGPEIQLISVYSALGDPSHAPEWAALVGVEEELRRLFEDEIQAKISAATAPPEKKRKTGGRAAPAAALVAELLGAFVSLPGRALVGSYGLAALEGKDPARAGGHLQIVSAHPLRDEEKAIQHLAARLGLAVQCRQYAMKIPSDPRLQRLTAYISRGGGRREKVLDVFNAGTYQLVAYSKGLQEGAEGGGGRRRRGPSQGGKKRRPGGGGRPSRKKTSRRGAPPAASARGAPVASPFVLMRLFLVEVWTVQLLHRLDAVSAEFARQTLRALVSDYLRAARLYARARGRGAFGRIFPSTFLGRYRDPVVHAKRARREEIRRAKRGPRSRRRFFPPFYPARAAAREKEDNKARAPTSSSSSSSGAPQEVGADAARAPTSSSSSVPREAGVDEARAPASPSIPRGAGGDAARAPTSSSIPRGAEEGGDEGRAPTSSSIPRGAGGGAARAPTSS